VARHFHPEDEYFNLQSANHDDLREQIPQLAQPVAAASIGNIAGTIVLSAVL